MEAGKITKKILGFFFFGEASLFFFLFCFFSRENGEKVGDGILFVFGGKRERNDGLIEMKFYIDLQFQPEMLRWRVSCRRL